MKALESIDLYCERLGPSLLAEPLNALTNAAFLVAAWLLLRRQYPMDVRPEVQRLAVLVGLVGVCSGLFHVTGLRGCAWLDTASIALFILFFLHRFFARLARWPAFQCLLGVVAFIAFERAFAMLGPLGLNGSEGYIPPWIALVGLTIASLRVAPSASGWLAFAAVVFPASFALRTLDMALCPQWPLGTHFGWHVLNALVLYACVRGLAAGCRDRL